MAVYVFVCKISITKCTDQDMMAYPLTSCIHSCSICMRFLLACLRLTPPLARPRFPCYSTMSPTQAKLDVFVKGKGSSANNAINIDSSTSTTPSKTNNKRPREDGTDVPVSAKKSKASGTYKAFPNGAPDPPEDTVEGLTSILAKLEEIQKKAKPVSVGSNLSTTLVILSPHRTESRYLVIHIHGPICPFPIHVPHISPHFCTKRNE